MASTSLAVPERKDEFCDLCFKYLTDPIAVECGHNFCRRCITDHYRERKREGLFFCPVCEEPIPEGKLWRILQQPSVEEKLRLLPEKSFVCPKHKVILDLFCQEDEKLICAVCHKSSEHKTHTVVSPKQAAQPLKDLLRSRIILLQEKKDIMENHPSDAENEIAELLEQMEEERGKLNNVFKQLHDFLHKQEKQLQNRMKMVEKDIQKSKTEYLEGLSKERTVLKSIIQEMREVCEQPAVEFLMVRWF
ncbi:E3 ubiquitin-protein ligase TRIM7-like isoform X1 [Pseudonaja textilis]|uniref:E3 ubiquitin-protein ligase TRIM7-like isoform X1 n=2 Tax=Pseudonaja textilis TaxID=8673 RepID=UPI000EA8E313|nr:E3 ubiquitin-protein ligase TRIM7-like isoform X1 [Pseudonaja textilis]